MSLIMNSNSSSKKVSVVLIGFMGSGKTTVGKALSKSGLEFLDTDAYIEKCEQMSISDIFAKKGEAYFRQAETRALESLLKETKPLVLSCGGGMPLREENRVLLKKLGTVVYLRVKPETVLMRLQGDTTRPLLQGDGSENKVRTLMKEREERYKAGADYILDVDEKTPEELASKILTFFS